MRRRDFITLVGGVAAWPVAARAQQPDRVPRIGVLMGTAKGDAEGEARRAAFAEGLQELGLVDGQNVRIDYRWSAGDVERMRVLASELAALAPHVIVAGNTPTLLAVRQATQTIPIVFVMVTDPVGQGFVQSLARPGTNITGFTTFEFSMMSKWLELFHELAPSTKRVALIYNPETAPYTKRYFPPFESAARTLTIEPIAEPVRSDEEIESSIVALAREPASGIIVMTDNFTLVHRGVIVSLVARYRLPAVYPFRFFASAGGLVSYGPDTIEPHRRAASYVDRILRGAKPADLPVQAPTKFEMIINLKTAKALGLNVPLHLQQLADEVIE
jgi:putative ABC transport system substrate-binding protein